MINDRQATGLLILGMVLGFLTGFGIGGSIIGENWREEMLDRGHIEYQIHPETNEKILVDSETGEEINLSK